MRYIALFSAYDCHQQKINTYHVKKHEGNIRFIGIQVVTGHARKQLVADSFGTLGKSSN